MPYAGLGGRERALALLAAVGVSAAMDFALLEPIPDTGRPTRPVDVNARQALGETFRLRTPSARKATETSTWRRCAQVAASGVPVRASCSRR